MKYWLFKTEPDAYSIDDLKRDRSTIWDGIRNYQARNSMRDDMSKGDLCVFYHSNAKPPAAVGVATIKSKDPVADPTQFDPESQYFDPKSDPDAPRWVCRVLSFKKRFARPVPLAELREDPALADMLLLQKGQRLSILPLTASEFERVCELGAG
ncbi:MAG: EVE domain-containing protein [Planctomycetes bacterium]|nr:EVE domain-containing protein [Planctomycetota bacterium]